MLHIDQIMQRLPHSHPFVLIDRILEWQKGEKLVAIKCVSAGEFWNPGHFPEEKLMPGVLILEAMAQAGGFLFQDPEKVERRVGYIAAIDKVRFFDKVIPGDVLRIEAECVSSMGSTAKIRCRALVADREVSSASITFHFS
jgi:3-hydroxyacyl-[acyl-carrier-protein] dehydratase